MTDVEDNRPKWMIELENRKRKPRLAHEAGAGSPCLSCKDVCPGLDLHFWRKICKNCKCGRDEHDVVDDDFPQFDLLLGSSNRPKRRAIFLPVANKKQQEKESAFDWVPPDITKELAADYMKALPENKLPIHGSAGAALRKQQLQKQLPRHDVDYKACDELSDHERQQFEKYLENLKKYVGQGKVIKISGARPFSKSLMTPANAADMQPMSPQRIPQGYLPNSQLVNLRTPSSFITKNSAQPTVQGLDKQQIWLTANLETIQAQLSENASGTGVRLGQYHPVLDNISATSHVVKSEIINSNSFPAQQTGNTHNFGTIKSNVNSTSPATGRKQGVTDVGKSHYQAYYPHADKEFEINPITETAELNTPADVQLLHATESHIPANSGNVRHISDISNRSKTENNPANVHDTPNNHLGADKPRILRDSLYPHDISIENAQSAEKMLSEALLPPSAVHANEIIGSTLDKDKLKYIQQQLSAKYSKDDPFAQNILKSLPVETSELQHSRNGNESGNLQTKTLDKVIDRAAIIAAMRNPSGFLAEEQRLDQIAPNYANSLDKSRSNLHPSSGLCRDGDVSHPSTPDKNIMGSCNQDYNKVPHQDSLTLARLGGQPSSIVHPCEQSSSSLQDVPQHNIHSLEGLNNPQFPINTYLPMKLSSDSSSESQYPAITHQYGRSNVDRTKFEQNPSDDSLEQQPAVVHNIQRDYPSDYNESKLDSNRALRYPSVASNNQQNEPIRAELTYQQMNSHLIYSQSLENPAFPEGIIDSPGLRQNPASVDQLRGALEELTVERIQLHKCNRCKDEIHSGDVVVTAERAKDAVWHPGCFVCSACNELLVDLVYFYHKGKLYCGRDLATLLNIPRCFACDELIFVREYTVAEGHNYHVKHFCCWDCDMPLAGQQYISENDRPLCLECYQKTYAKTCKTCNIVIAADQQGVALKNLNFHANDSCFSCFTCKKSLLSGKIAIKEDKPFCSKECIMEFTHRRS